MDGANRVTSDQKDGESDPDENRAHLTVCIDRCTAVYRYTPYSIAKYVHLQWSPSLRTLAP